MGEAEARGANCTRPEDPDRQGDPGQVSLDVPAKAHVQELAPGDHFAFFIFVVSIVYSTLCLILTS